MQSLQGILRLKTSQSANKKGVRRALKGLENCDRRNKVWAQILDFSSGEKKQERWVATPSSPGPTPTLLFVASGTECPARNSRTLFSRPLAACAKRLNADQTTSTWTPTTCPRPAPVSTSARRQLLPLTAGVRVYMEYFFQQKFLATVLSSKSL